MCFVLKDLGQEIRFNISEIQLIRLFYFKACTFNSVFCLQKWKPNKKLYYKKLAIIGVNIFWVLVR